MDPNFTTDRLLPDPPGLLARLVQRLAQTDRFDSIRDCGA